MAFSGVTLFDCIDAHPGLWGFLAFVVVAGIEPLVLYILFRRMVPFLSMVPPEKISVMRSAAQRLIQSEEELIEREARYKH